MNFHGLQRGDVLIRAAASQQREGGGESLCDVGRGEEGHM